jgi:hypothetical protein
VTALVSWSSGTTTVANVTAGGLVTAVAQGASTITGASGSVTVASTLTAAMRRYIMV